VKFEAVEGEETHLLERSDVQFATPPTFQKTYREDQVSCFSEKSVHFYEITDRHIPEDLYIH